MNKSILRPTVCAILVITAAILLANFLSASKSQSGAEPIDTTTTTAELTPFVPSELNTWLAQESFEIESIEGYRESASTPVVININIYVTDDQFADLNGDNDPI